MVENLKALVEAFAFHTEAQTHEMFHGDVEVGNDHARKSSRIYKKLLSYGDVGRDALAVLLTHPSMDVRTAAAAILLRHRTAEAKAVLEEAAKGKGLIPFEASLALKSWEDGTWNFDTKEDASPRLERSRPEPSSSRNKASSKRASAKGRKRRR